MLQTDSALNTTLQTVKDNVGNSSTLLLSTVDAQFNSTLRIHTDSSELLDIEDTGANNRFNINRVVQQINLDFASKPTDVTTIVGAIRTAQDGVNLSNALYFRENGQATFTERLGIESDSTVTTQTSAVIQATTTNANLVLNPNGTGAIVASIPDGTATGGNARGSNAVDLQLSRALNTQVASGTASTIAGGANNIASGIASVVSGGGTSIASGNYSTVAGGANNIASAVNSTVGGGQVNTSSAYASTVSGGYSNTASINYSTVCGGQSNIASTNTHATVIGGSTNTASGQYSVAGGKSNTASNSSSVSLGDSNNSSGTTGIAIGRLNVSSGLYSVAIGNRNQATTNTSSAFGSLGYAYISSQNSFGNGITFLGDCQYSTLLPFKESLLTSSSTTILYADGASALMVPSNNRSWNVTIKWVAIVTSITGTATGITVNDTITQIQTLGFKRSGGISSIIGTVNTISTNTDASMSTASLITTAGASNELKLTFTAPTFAGGGSINCRIVARVELTEVAW